VHRASRALRPALPLALIALAACGGSVSIGGDAGSKVAPAGAPFSYVVPDGFSIARDITTSAGTGAPDFRTGVGIGDGGRDLVLVSSYTLQKDVSTVADAAIGEEITGVVKGLVGTSRTYTGPTRQKVAGVDAFVYVLTDAAAQGGPETTTSYYLFRGTHEVNVLCQAKERRADIDRGCKAVLDSLLLA
jgi:hypothetical protein